MHLLGEPSGALNPAVIGRVIRLGSGQGEEQDGARIPYKGPNQPLANGGG